MIVLVFVDFNIDLNPQSYIWRSHNHSAPSTLDGERRQKATRVCLARGEALAFLNRGAN